ncbi:hypothetical protein [Allomuricauda sp. F6463D]|uniref:hypothetical protein n=1 Tax=Allomuricauda sp. F6463D TaxID=2926409 RepID=UPI001FF32470|nr:hypothetical protein [Muricauda sp. F6463D]MCK0160843.1 hypothetical protein [Muricauda sp. F6463D]
MKTNKTHTKSRIIQTGCAVMCMFYLLGLFNGLVLETLHEVSHVLTPSTHHHNFASDHETTDYASLKAMAGHSHEGLEALKDLLKANHSDEQDSKDKISLTLDKHFVEKTHLTSEINFLVSAINNWAYQDKIFSWCHSVTTPPPQNS